MRTLSGDPIQYHLDLSSAVNLNERLGQELKISWSGLIFCQKCSKQTRNSFGEGFCYNCFTTAAEASECILRPELCRAHLGEGRDPQWEQEHHNQPHVVYLALSSAVKVGITRAKQLPTRWIDQGASFAIILAETPNRFEAGRIEVALKSFFTDKTNWQKMLRNEVDESLDLVASKWSLEEHLPQDILAYFSENDSVLALHYPVINYPEKVKSLSLEKTPTVAGKLVGIKGQYLLFENGDVLNVRKHTGFQVTIE